MANIGNCGCFLYGPMSLSSVIKSCSVLLPIGYGCLVYQETMTLHHLLGIACLILLFILTGLGNREGKKEISPRWFLTMPMSFLAMVFVL